MSCSDPGDVVIHGALDHAQGASELQRCRRQIGSQQGAEHTVVELGVEGRHPDAVREGILDEDFRTMADESQARREVLKVAGTSKPVLVAGAIAGVIRSKSRVEVHAIGAGAVNQAIKAIAISRGYVLPAGLDLVCIPSFIDLSLDGQERTGIRLLVEVR